MLLVLDYEQFPYISISYFTMEYLTHILFIV